MHDFNWNTPLDLIPGTYRFSQRDFDAAEKIFTKHYLTPDTTPPGTRVTTPPNFATEMKFMELVTIAKRLKGDSRFLFPTMGQVRAELAKRETERKP
jgi:hypothetical protein